MLKHVFAIHILFFATLVCACTWDTELTKYTGEICPPAGSVMACNECPEGTTDCTLEQMQVSALCANSYALNWLSCFVCPENREDCTLAEKKLNLDCDYYQEMSSSSCLICPESNPNCSENEKTIKDSCLNIDPYELESHKHFSKKLGRCATGYSCAQSSAHAKRSLCVNLQCDSPNVCPSNESCKTDNTGCHNNSCKNDDQHCGYACINCKLIPGVQSAACSSSGLCDATSCNSGWHLERRTDGTKYCIQNSNLSCAPPTSTETKDCTQISNSDTVACNSDGVCTIINCKPGFHIKKDGQEYSCEKNELTKCGLSNTEASDCTEIENMKDASSDLSFQSIVECNGKGLCKIHECAAQFHIKSDNAELKHDSCEENSSTQCGPPTATATNCESIPNQKNPQDATCNNDGFCKVKECYIGYHLKQAQQLHDACNINSVQACGAVNKNPINCLEIEKLAPATPPTQDNPNPPAHVECSTEGKCHIKQCDKTFHILRADQNTPHDTCEQNSARKCGKPTQTQNEVIDCTITPNATSTTCVENGSCHMGNCSGFSCDTNLEYSQAIDCTGKDNSCRFVCTQEGYAFCTLSRVVCLKLTYGLTEDECNKCPNTCSQGQLCYKSAPNEYKCTNP